MMLVKKEIQTWGETNRILQYSKDYIYILPCSALQDWISNYTITFPNKDILSDQYTVIPHGSATLVFYSDGCGFHSDLFGPITKPCMVGSLANRCEMLLIIEFQPAGLYAFTGITQKELANKIFPFALVNPTLNRLFLEMLEMDPSLDLLIAHLDKLLWNNLHTDCPSSLRLATKMTLETTGNISCKALSASVCYSERHLNRIYEQYLGMNTKTFSRLVRINKAIRYLQTAQRNVTSASYEAGFYDSPHFIHDFKSVCGMTPQEYRNNMSDFYNEIAKF